MVEPVVVERARDVLAVGPVLLEFGLVRELVGVRTGGSPGLFGPVGLFAFAGPVLHAHCGPPGGGLTDGGDDRERPNTNRKRAPQHGITTRNLAIAALRQAGQANIAKGLRWAARGAYRPLQLLNINV